MGQVILVRHGQQQWPSGRRPSVADWVDPPLSDTGQAQAVALGAALADEPVDAVLCSHLRRAHETALAVAAHHGLEPEVHAGLREVELYRDAPPETSVRELLRDPAMHSVNERFVRERRWDVFPYTETGDELRQRVTAVIEGAITARETPRLVVICHGGVINAWIAQILGLAQDMFFRPGHASLSRVRVRDGQRVVHSLNDTHHLRAVAEDLVTC